MARAGSERNSIQNEGSMTNEASVLSDPVSILATEATNRIAGIVTMTPEVRDSVHGIIQEEFADMGMDLWEQERVTASAQSMANLIGNYWKDRAERAEARAKFLESDIGAASTLS